MTFFFFSCHSSITYKFLFLTLSIFTTFIVSFLCVYSFAKPNPICLRPRHRISLYNLRKSSRIKHWVTCRIFRPKEGDSGFDMWDEADSLIMSWLWNSMNPKISNTCMFLSTTKEIRDAVQQMYLKAYDATQV